MDTNSKTALSPLSCPRCGCAESRVIHSRRLDRSARRQPLPALIRVRECTHCEKQFRTHETLDEIHLASTVWRCRRGTVVVDRSQLSCGDYPGEWTRYTVEVMIEGVLYSLDTRNHMRASRYPCRVEVTPTVIVVNSENGDAA